MTDFDFDVVQKKRIARGAFNKKCGSKSKLCKLPTDYMSRREWEKKNGAIFTYNLNKPMTWNEFKGMPVDLQREYMKKLRLFYDVNMAMVRDMFEISQPTLRKYFEKYGMTDIFPRTGGRTPDAVRARWQAFCDGDEAIEPLPSEKDENAFESVEVIDPSDIPEIVNEVAESQSFPLSPAPAKNKPMAMHHFTLCFNGKLDPDMIANSIRNLVGNDTMGRIDIHCDLEG